MKLTNHILEKVKNNIRITAEDGLDLFASDDLVGIGGIANFIKQKQHQNHVSYIINKQINPTNVCILSCSFCDFAHKKNQPGSYEMSIKEILNHCSEDLKEVHIVSGLNADWPFEFYVEIIKKIHQTYPSIQIKAYTAVEIDFFSRTSKKSISSVLSTLKEAGVICLPGGGAEVFSDRVRESLFKTKIDANQWLNIHRQAHMLGLKSNATLLYGHIETVEERVQHILKLRKLQDETNGFLSFIPLPYQISSAKLVSRPTSIIDNLKTIAIARILLDNFEHIKSYWVTMGEESATISLLFGADDIDGTIGNEKIMHAANKTNPISMTQKKLEFIIQSSGNVPTQRDALYRYL